MADFQGMPAEIAFRILWKLSPTGAPMTTADGDGNVFFLPGSSTMTNEAGALYSTVAAITDVCLKRAAVQNVSGAELLVEDCPMDGAQTLLGKLVNGLTNSYDALGNVVSLDIQSAASGACATWQTGAAAAGRPEWALLDAVGVRDCGDNQVAMTATVARRISATNPTSGRPIGGGRSNPGAATTSFTMGLKDNIGFGAGPAGLLPMFDQDGVTVSRNPLSSGYELTVPASYESLVNACACDSAYRAVPLTNAIIAANPELNVGFLTGV